MTKLSLANTIDSIESNELHLVNDEQTLLLEETKKSLLKKIKEGSMFHSVQFETSQLEDSNRRGVDGVVYQDRVIEKDPLVARGVQVMSLSEDELALAKEVFGVVMQSKNQYFLPVEIRNQHKVEQVIEDVDFKVSRILDKTGLDSMAVAMPVGGAIAGAINLLSTHGPKVILHNLSARFMGVAKVMPAMMPVLTGVAVAGGIATLACAVAPVSRRILEMRNKHLNQKDGDELLIAQQAVSQISFDTILSTERSNLLPELTKEIENKIQEPGREFAKKIKLG